MIEFREAVSPSERSAVARFYKSSRQKARPREGDRLWVATQGDQALGAVRLCHPDFGPWLRTLYVTPQWRQLGIGRKLIETLLVECGEQTVWCLPFDRKAGLYGRCGFSLAAEDSVPRALRDRWARYQRSGIDLAIMVWHPPETKGDGLV